MKNTIAILAILTFTSCKKEYNCRCVDKDNHEVYSDNLKIKKSDVDAKREQCKGEAVGLIAEDPQLAPITCTLQ